MIGEITFDFDSSEYSISEINDINRCLKNLYSTKEGTQALDRSFGLNTDFIGKPIPVVESELTIEIITKTEIYEPRVVVDNVTFVEDANNGAIFPKVHLKKGDEDYNEY